ncbi:hypothetical protein [Nitrosomonas sp.]|uniref:hypothetical protein n=1 Tax=Nitrosomonas sp. TaxID=42353 RepID=UPI00374D6341
MTKHIGYNLLSRWFVRLDADDPAWDHNTFTKKTTGTKLHSSGFNLQGNYFRSNSLGMSMLCYAR